MDTYPKTIKVLSMAEVRRATKQAATELWLKQVGDALSFARARLSQESLGPRQQALLAAGRANLARN